MKLMRGNNKIYAFTLVELIVVITILAILGTIGFISMNGFNNDAKNTKVISDLRNLAGALEAVKTTKDLRLNEVMANSGTTNTISSSSIINGSGAIIGAPGITYMVGSVDFSKLGQNGTSFKDPNSYDEQQEYIYAIAYNTDFSFFQFAGQIIEKEQKKAKLTGTYAIKDELQDAKSIISSRANDTPIEDNEVFVGDLYQ